MTVGGYIPKHLQIRSLCFINNLLRKDFSEKNWQIFYNLIGNKIS